MASFKVGDVVRLKSGGDPMTVVEVTPFAEYDYGDRAPRGVPTRVHEDSSQDQVSCVWFPIVEWPDGGGPVHGGDVKRETFEAVLLVATRAWSPKEKR